MKNWRVLLGAFLIPASVAAAELAIAPGVRFSGSPSYVSEFATRFRDNGGPLSPYGSHFGLKAEVGTKEFAGVRHFACATGKNIIDYSRTGLVGVSSVRFLVDGKPVREAEERQISFEYFGWQEQARFRDFFARARVSFLGLDQYLIGVRVENTGPKPLALNPVFVLAQKAKKLKLVKSADPAYTVLKFSVQPTIVQADNYLAVTAAAPAGMKKGASPGEYQMEGEAISLQPGESREFWYLFGYSPDGAEPALAVARKAREEFQGPDAAWQAMAEMRERLFQALPKPHLAAGQDDYRDLYRMAAAALENALYAPRGKMQYWACVPTKVHYNWFWLWDSGFEALGYNEFKPAMGREVILTMFQAMQPDGFIAHMADERAEPLTPHSQPPVFGFSGGKMIARFAEDPAHREFEKVMYEKGKLFLQWWKQERDVNHDGLFEYLSQDEGGWDNSPRADYVRKYTFISYYGYLGELIGAKLKPLDNVDANAWMYLYYRAMRDWAGDLGYADEAVKWQEEANTLAKRVDEVLWDESRGCWFDTYQRRGSKQFHHFPVLTPAIWFPAFAGATRDEHKARTCIERHLLNPNEFWGKYPIPLVAYNDPKFDDTTVGWTASIWLVTAYTGLEALFKFGYEQEARELRERLLRMMAGQNGMKGIYETYDPFTGLYKNEYSTGGYASFQFGWSSAFALEMILERYQEERFVFSDSRKFQGFIRRAEDFQTRAAFYQVRAGLDVPRVELESADSLPLLETHAVRIKLTDPYQSMTRQSFSVWIKGKKFEVELGKESVLTLE
jgi:hypothetical protein